ncbi:unnamed protein product [Symbiodinium sp. KB8]|nr:unnamed protein product [Symbiodinium sp. KB8]
MVMLLQEAEHLVDGGLDEWLRDWCTDEVLRMFLGASSKESAVKSLAAALNWRRRYKDVLTGLRIFMSMHHQPSKSNSISTAEHLAVVLEAAVCSAKGTPRSFDVVCDCRGFQLSKNLDPRPAVSAMEMLKHAYRGRMRRAFLVGAPAAFGGFWKLLKGLLPKPTQDKIQFIALKEAGDVLQGSCGHAAAHVVTTLLASDQDSTSWRFPSELAD